MRGRPGWLWAGRIVAAVVLIGLIAYLASVGLDKANEIAGVLGLIVALAALLAPYLLAPGDGGKPDGGSPEGTAPAGYAQRIENVRAGGNVSQVRYAAPPSGPSADPAAGPAPAAPSGGQYIGGVWTAGDVSQTDGADPAR